jgi:Inhibitor of Apoptosis domain
MEAATQTLNFLDINEDTMETNQPVFNCDEDTQQILVEIESVSPPLKESDPNYKYHCEWIRCLSFCGNNLSCTVRELQEAARYGFVWECTDVGHENGYLKCVFCDLRINKWDVKELIALKHFELNPFCPLLRHGMVVNFTASLDDPYQNQLIPEIRMGGGHRDISDLLQSQPTTIPLIPTSQGELQYSVENFEKRLKTFHDNICWHGVADIDDLAMYGFHYTGYKDRAECEFCGLSITYWKNGMLAAVEHRFWSPSCQFLKKFMNYNEEDEIVPECFTSLGAEHSCYCQEVIDITGDSDDTEFEEDDEFDSDYVDCNTEVCFD